LVKLLRNICHCDIAEIRFVAKQVIIQTFYQQTGWILFKHHDKSSPLNYTHYAMLYSQNGGRIDGHRFCDVTSSHAIRDCVLL